MSHEVTFNADAERYEILVDGQLAGLTEAHATAEGTLLFPHTEVGDAFEGQGLAGELVSKALDDVRERGLKIVATCPYVSRYIEKHQDYADLLA